MAISIQTYTAEHISAVRAFNQRLAAGGIAAEFHFPESNIPYWLPKEDGRRIYQEYYLALEGRDVRGAFILKFQNFVFGQEALPIVYYHLPVSEGIVNKSYASVGVLMLRSALKMQPRLFALGMGGFDRPLPTMLKAMGWSLAAVPFHFRVHHPRNFLRQIAPLRQSAGRRALAGIAARTGTGWLGIKAFQWLRTQSPRPGIVAEAVPNFGPWADNLWNQHASRYNMIGNRQSETLNVLYPVGKNFLCLKITRAAEVLGWAVLLDTQMRNNKYFGTLRVGTVVDAFAAPENSGAVIHAATQVLANRGVDLMLANHTHVDWGKAFQAAGYLRGQSNFLFAASKALSEKIGAFETNSKQIFLMRGDGDGPVNL